MRKHSIILALAMIAVSGICNADAGRTQRDRPTTGGEISPRPGGDSTSGNDYGNCTSTEDGGVDCEMCYSDEEIGISKCIRVPWSSDDDTYPGGSSYP